MKSFFLNCGKKRCCLSNYPCRETDRANRPGAVFILCVCVVPKDRNEDSEDQLVQDVCLSQTAEAIRAWSNDARLSMLYKIRSSLAHCPTLEDKTGPPPHHVIDTRDKQFTLLTTRTQYRGSSSFLPKTIRDCNSLPMKVVEAFRVKGIKLQNYL